MKDLAAAAEKKQREAHLKELMEQEKSLRVKQTENALRTQAAKGLATRQKQLAKTYQTGLEQARAENEALQQEDRREKQAKHQHQQEFQARHHKHMEERNPYASKISAASVNNSKSLSKRTDLA